VSELNPEIKQAIDGFDVDKARQLLKDAMKNGDAETYYLAARVALDEKQKREFLEKAVELDPFHQNAREELQGLSGGSTNSANASSAAAPSKPSRAGSTGKIVTQTRDNEVVFNKPFHETYRDVVNAVNRLGKVKQGEQSRIVGTIKYGLQSVKVNTSVVEEDAGSTRVVIQASSDDVWQQGAKNATRRLIELLLNIENPGYEPDRLGMHPAALVGIIILFVIVLLFILSLII
jgi:hypothetical protein